MDSWYATKNIILYIESLEKVYYCLLKSNRKVDDSEGKSPYQRVDSLMWTQAEMENGKMIKIHQFPKNHKVKLFRVEVSTHRTDYIVTNAKAQLNVAAVEEICGFRWKIEQFHREIKQVTGIEKRQCGALSLSKCRKARIVRNHIGCAMLVWVRLTDIAHQTGFTIYNFKESLLSNYIR